MRITTGTSRTSKKWSPRAISYPEFLQQISKPTVSRETLSEYLALTVPEQAELKDVGGFVGGTLKGTGRKTANVTARSLVTLDADNMTAEDLTTLTDRLKQMKVPAAVYSTRKSTPQKPRVRVIIPLSRECEPEKYEPIARKICERLGMGFFDRTTAEVARLMYWPSVCADQVDSFIFFTVNDTDAMLDPDEVLKSYADWKDVRQWPVFPGAAAELRTRCEKQQDPLEKPGLIGAFCRTYSVEEAIEKFIPDAYEACGDGRYTFVQGSTSAGAVVYDDGRFLFSNHATDPAGGELCNAYDLVRLHLFGETKEGVKQMNELIASDAATTSTLKHEKLDNALDDFKGVDASDSGGSDYIDRLTVDGKGKIKTTVSNVRLILNNDPGLAGCYYLELFSMTPMVSAPVPWEGRKHEYPRQWSDADDAGLRDFLEAKYDIVHAQKVSDGLLLALEDNGKHQIKEYLEGLEWDGRPRLDTILIDYLGAADNIYTRETIRKALIAAVTRVYRPGAKFDNMVILVGSQGIGKSTLLSKLGRQWFSDSLSEFEGKEAFEMLHKNWIMEIPELEGFGRYTMNAIKKFLSKQVDEYRAPYARRTMEYPRKNVIFGTTNDAVFLRDRTGNRRFWPVETEEQKPTLSVFRDLTDDVVGQIWAEAYAGYLLGESLILSDAAEEIAEREQESRLEDDPREGQIIEFIATPIPTDWDSRTLDMKRLYYNSPESDTSEKVKRSRICAAEVWCELFRYELTSFDQAKSRDVNRILAGISGLKKSVRRFGEYGRQRGYSIDETFYNMEKC